MQIPGSTRELICVYLLEKFHLNSYFRFCDLNDDGNQYVMFWTVLYDPEAKISKNTKGQIFANPGAEIATHVNLLEIPAGMMKPGSSSWEGLSASQ